ncbi:hypothetical protein HY411_00545 [Candidatus Gottesmanbacteria bacterium]|nr:hypothetical protein [Candidatus Gottesmanbacteria bacterium]
MSCRNVAIAALILLTSATPVVAATSTVKEFRAEVAASRAATREAVKEKIQETREAAKERWEELKANREATRDAIRANIQAMREEVKAKVTAMRDERKKLVVQRIQTKLAEVNKRRTDHFLKVLERLSTILDKIQSRTEKAKAEGKNVSTVEAAIASARTAISTAESAVNTQKAKTYQITVTDDTTARNDVGVTAKQLESDLRAVQETVQAARQAVQNVFRQIKTVVGSGIGVTPTATGSSVTQ